MATETKSLLVPAPGQLSLTTKNVKDIPTKTTGTQNVQAEIVYTRRPYVPKSIIIVENVEPVAVRPKPREVAEPRK